MNFNKTMDIRLKVEKFKGLENLTGNWTSWLPD
jgi:hypothetical protein